MAKTFKLNTGFECPSVGYGTAHNSDKDPNVLKEAVKAAVKAGYRHIDTAQAYQCEHIIGQALQELYKEGVVARSDMFITTKLHGTHYKPDRARQAIERQLKELQTDYIDLYLMHMSVALQMPSDEKQLWPISPEGKIMYDMETSLEETWKVLEELHKAGTLKSIGVSNFNIPLMEKILKCNVKPAMLQVEISPIFHNKKLVDFCKSHNIRVTGYSSFGSPGNINPANGKPICAVDLLNNEKLLAIGKPYGKNAAQVIVRWMIQNGTVVIPKSMNAGRIAANFNVWDFELSDKDMAEITSMDTNKRNADAPAFADHPNYPFTEEGSC